MHDIIPNEGIIREAHERIRPYLHRTPIFTNHYLDQLTGCHLFFKCENFQKVGAFKARGGLNTVLQLTPDELKRGVATHSSGNHAQGLALAAKTAQARAYIVMPSSAPSIKKAAVRDYGAEIIECEPTLEAREATLGEVVQKTGATVVHPYNDHRVIAGQATAAKEFLEDVDAELDYLLTPVGGGGLLSGTALASHYFPGGPIPKVIGCEPEGADDAWQSFHTGKLVPQLHPDTIADGLRTSVGEKPFKIIQKYVTDILLADDMEIIAAMRLVWERMKIIIEPSCAVPLAALLRHKERFAGKNVGIILTGGNVDLAQLPFQ